MTGIYTGRSPKDKFIVMDENSKDTVCWTSDEYKNDNHPASEETWNAVKDLAIKELSNKKLYVDVYKRQAILCDQGLIHIKNNYFYHKYLLFS